MKRHTSLTTTFMIIHIVLLGRFLRFGSISDKHICFLLAKQPFFPEKT